MWDIVPTSPLTSPLNTIHASRVQLFNKFFIYQPDDGQWKVPKHVVVIYVINIIYIYIYIHQLVVLDSRYTAILVYSIKIPDEGQ